MYPDLNFLCIVFVIKIFQVNLIDATIYKSNRYDYDQFRHCMHDSDKPRLRECAGRAAINFLQNFAERENVTFMEDLVYTKDENVAPRSLANLLDADPVDFRGILENAGAIFSQRSLEWHMDNLYPGLMLKIGPTANSNSVLEFAIDPSIVERNYGVDDTSTARLLAKHYLVPFLLGLKLNLVALVPLLFAVVCLLLKKSLLIVKLAIYFSGLLGIGGPLASLGSFGGWGGGLGGGLGAGLAGGLTSGFVPPIHGPFAHSNDAGLASYFPGKTTVVNHYTSDELQYQNAGSSVGVGVGVGAGAGAPYKRNDRKINFDKPTRNNFVVKHKTTTTTTTKKPTDHFYDYEKKILMQDRRTTTNNGQLNANIYDDGNEEHFHAHDHHLGWKVVDVRSL